MGFPSCHNCMLVDMEDSVMGFSLLFGNFLVLYLVFVIYVIVGIDFE